MVKELFSTNTGSHAWMMNRPESDVDYYVVFQVPSVDFLMEKAQNRSSHTIVGEDDKQSHEIGKVVSELLKGNFNHLVGVLTPLVINDWNRLPELRRLTKINFSKQCYNSIHGLATHNMRKYITNPSPDIKPLSEDAKQKKLNTIMRTLNFGIYLLEKGDVKFDAAWDTSEGDVEHGIMELDEVFHNCDKLPDKPQHVDEMMKSKKVDILSEKVVKLINREKDPMIRLEVILTLAGASVHQIIELAELLNPEVKKEIITPKDDVAYR